MRPRVDLQGPVHKGLRGAMADALVAVGRMDVLEDCEVRDALARLEDMLCVCEAHARLENEIVSRAIEARRPGATQRFAADHDVHAGIIDQLRELAARRDPSLYGRLSAFVAEMLAHLAREEWEGDAVLREAFDAAEIAQLQRRMFAALCRSDAMPTLRWMIPMLSHGERVVLLQGLGEVDAPAFEGALALARTHLSAREFGKLDSGLRRNDEDGLRRNEQTARAGGDAVQV